MLALFSTFGLAALGFGQSQVFNFQSYDVNSAFSGTSVNRNGVVMGMFFDSALGSAYQTTWSASQGFRIVTTQAGDNYQSKITDGGNVYGDSAGKIIGWNASGGRSVILGDASMSYSLVSASDNDRLLVKGIDGAGTHYFTYSSGSGLQTVNPLSASFTPVQVNMDGSVYGMVPGGSSGGFGLPSTVFAKLNSDGSYTADPRSHGNYSGTAPMGSGTVNNQEAMSFLPNGNVLVTTRNTTVVPGETLDGSNYHVYLADGSDYDYGITTETLHIGTFTSGSKLAALLGDGASLGTDQNGASIKIFSSTKPAGVDFGANNLAPGSAVPYQILFGNESVVVGQAFDANGNRQLLIAKVGSVPEPASLAVLGLGAIALLRRRCK